MTARDGDAVARRLLEPLQRRRGVRIVCLGVTGSGKSYALRRLAMIAAPMVDVLYAVDDSEDYRDWRGQIRADIADCRARPLVRRDGGGSNIVVLTGDPIARIRVDCEAVAGDAWAQVTAHRRTAAIAIDELRRAAPKPQRWAVEGGDMAETFTEGRKIGLSGFAATNFPQEVPREAIGQSTLLLFTLDGGAIDYLRTKRWISREVADALETLPMHDFLVREPGALPDLTPHRF